MFRLFSFIRIKLVTLVISFFIGVSALAVPGDHDLVQGNLTAPHQATPVASQLEPVTPNPDPPTQPALAPNPAPLALIPTAVVTTPLPHFNRNSAPILAPDPEWRHNPDPPAEVIQPHGHNPDPPVFFAPQQPTSPNSPALSISANVRSGIISLTERLCSLLIPSAVAAEISGAPTSASIQAIPSSAILPIGIKIWFNEADGRDEKLIEWNEGEKFLSLGIGHFIWYPKGSSRGSWDEGFPKLMRYLKAHGAKDLPDWLTATKGLRAPWPNRQAFLADQHGKIAIQLRRLLRRNLALQAQFLVEEMLASFPDMLAVTPLEDKEMVRRNFNLLLKDPKGVYAMVDYFNFKGAGAYPSLANYYHGSGLLQVLSKMRLAPPDFSPLQSFVYAAKLVMTQKFGEVPNAHFQRWYKGWFNRLNSYLES